MTKLTDPVTGEELILLGMQGESNEIYRFHEVDSVVGNLAQYLRVTTDEVIRILRNSDATNPVIMHDEVFWVE